MTDIQPTAEAYTAANAAFSTARVVAAAFQRSGIHTGAPLLFGAVVRAVWPLAMAEGYQRAIEIVAAALDEAQAEPRGHGPTHRAGRITALGIVLQRLRSESP